jgi:hypothetical protein
LRQFSQGRAVADLEGRQMIVSLLVSLLVIVAIVVLVRRRPGTAAPGLGGATSVRLFFQYLLLFGLVVVVAIGVSGLLGRALESRPFAQDDLALARNLAFVAVGTPLLALVTWWSWRRVVAEPAERTTVALAFTVLLAGVVSLVMVMTSAHAVLVWLFGADYVSRTPLATLLTWGLVLAAVWWVSTIIAPPVLRLYHLVGSLFGLATAAAGAVGLGGDLLSRAVFGDNPDRYAMDLWSALASVLVGLPVWAVYWWARARSAERDTPWLAYVILAGVGGGFVTALVAFSTALATTGIWLFGEPTVDVAEIHFSDLPAEAAAVVVGLLVWWYHRTVLREAGTTARSRVQRLYEYLMAGIALVAAAVGLTFLVAAGIEAAVGSRVEPTRGSVANTLVVAATVLLVGLPVWALFWRRVQLARRDDPVAECGSTVRRTYLALLVGIGAVAAVVAAITGAYRLFQDAVTSTVDSMTLQSMRFPIGIVLAAGAVGVGNTVQLYRDRRVLPAPHPNRARWVLLVGPADPDLARAVAHATGARVQHWYTDDGTPWSVQQVVDAVTSERSDVLVLSDRDGLRAIPIHGPERHAPSEPEAAMLSG